MLVLLIPIAVLAVLRALAVAAFARHHARRWRRPGLAAVHAAGLGDRSRLQRGGGDRARGEVAGGRRLPGARGGGRRRRLCRWHGRDRRGPRSAGGAGDPAAERGQGRGAERRAGGRVGGGDRHRRRRHRVRGQNPAPAGGAVRRPRGRGGGREHEGGQPPRPARELAAHRLRDRVQPRPAPLRHAPLHADGSGRRRGVPAPRRSTAPAASRARPWRRTRT